MTPPVRRRIVDKAYAHGYDRRESDRLHDQAGALVDLLQPYADSYFRLERFRRNVFPELGLDWEKIRNTSRNATSDLYNFSHHRHEVVTPGSDGGREG